jgi:hypothetical protein
MRHLSRNFGPSPDVWLNSNGLQVSTRPASSFDHVAHGTPTALREYIAECIALAADQAGLVQTSAEIGDDKGLEYALRYFVAYAKAAFSTFQDLKADHSQLKAQ